ncbi:Vacuolar cation-chloride cotransporter 1 [Ceratocystis fimbriata CBS 114723]|uniref:Vacuolar cation-chloride cotransporter 1 n=1 Tax=Ceratocystis fimbriata CBS 114723 TaxID=1035309 RepID=A0A2C5WZU4_9PEZI|nr:Vacuolar cation-chloride cotransporter 1 [Ceratocystis fimbriata CBS 114723]
MRRRRKLLGSSSSHLHHDTGCSSPPAGRLPAEKLDATSGVFIPVCLNILSILMFLRFGVIVGQIGLLGIVGLLLIAYSMNFLTALSLSAIASNGEVKGGGAYYLISRSLGPEFGGSLGLLFFVSQVLNTSLNVVGLLDCLRLNFADSLPDGFWVNYALETVVLLFCTAICVSGSSTFTKANNVLLLILLVSVASIPFSAIFKAPFVDAELGVEFTGVSLSTLSSNLLPHFANGHYNGVGTFRELFGILFPATSGIFAGASMSGYLRNPSHSIPKGTLWAMLATLVCYLVVSIAMASSITHESLMSNFNVILLTNISAKLVIAGECVVTLFSALMGLLAAANLLRALARDKLLPGMEPLFSRFTKRDDDPALFLMTYALAQLALLADLNQIATLISMGYHMTFFIMNLACFLLKIGAAPNFRPGFKFFNWQTAAAGAVCSAFTMFFINETYASVAVLLLVLLFALLHYLSPPKRWGDVSQNLLYHQVRKYLLRLQPEHIKFWRPHIILLVNDPRSQAPLIQFCNSLKKGSLYILGHVIVTENFDSCVHEAKVQQMAWTRYISEYSRLKAFVQLTVSPSLTWGVRNLILSAGLGGMKPNIAILGFYRTDKHKPAHGESGQRDAGSRSVWGVADRPKDAKQAPETGRPSLFPGPDGGGLPTDHIRVEDSMKATEYMTILEDLALRYKINVAIGKGFESLEIPQKKASGGHKKYIDLWPIQISADVTSHGRSIHTTNFDTYTLILQLGYILWSVPNWKAAYMLRIMVFVEYENEVDKEKARVKALLEKLRIDADIRVFWLANGSLSTYNLVVNGVSSDSKAKQRVHFALRNEPWWHEMQLYRSLQLLEVHSSPRQHLPGNTTAYRRGSLFAAATDSKATVERFRRHSITDLLAKPSVFQLARLGVTVGIHTNHLTGEVVENDDDGMYLGGSPGSGGSGTDYSDEEAIEDFTTDDEGGPDERKSSDALCQPLLRGPPSSLFQSSASLGRAHSRVLRSYGSASSSSCANEPSASRCYGSFSAFTALTPKPRPALPRQKSAVRFTSRLMPETLTNVDAESNMGRSIMFAEAASPNTDAIDAGTLITGREKQKNKKKPNKKGKKDKRDKKARASLPSACRSSPTSTSLGPPSIHSPSGPSPKHDPRPLSSTGPSGSAYSTQHMNLSFNDLPSRAQHLILNELMVQHSKPDAAVLLSTLPIPVEGTGASEEASLSYLEDVDVLCSDLPPTLLVLSNHMTVTVEL